MVAQKLNGADQTVSVHGNAKRLSRAPGGTRDLTETTWLKKKRAERLTPNKH
jgi:hypothetical protein